MRNRILVVDDEENQRKILSTVLARGIGVQCFTAGSKAEAIALAGPCTQDLLVITDYRMPNGTGYDLACELRSRDPSIPIIVVTGNQEEIEDKEMFSDIIMKPVTISVLLALSKKYLAH